VWPALFIDPIGIIFAPREHKPPVSQTPPQLS
jgi:hypothetical protein